MFQSVAYDRGDFGGKGLRVPFNEESQHRIGGVRVGIGLPVIETELNDNSVQGDFHSAASGVGSGQWLDVWRASDVHGTEVLEPGYDYLETPSFDNQAKALKAHIDRGELRRAEHLIDKMVNKHQGTEGAELLHAILCDYGVDQYFKIQDLLPEEEWMEHGLQGLSL